MLEPLLQGTNVIPLGRLLSELKSSFSSLVDRILARGSDRQTRSFICA